MLVHFLLLQPTGRKSSAQVLAITYLGFHKIFYPACLTLIGMREYTFISLSLLDQLNFYQKFTNLRGGEN